MTNVIKVLLGLLTTVLLFAAVTVSSVIGINNSCVQQEAGLTAQYKQNQNNYDNFIKKVNEIAQVPAMYTEDLKNVYKAVVTGRYGNNGSRAMFQFIKEHNPNFDSNMYVRLQQVIESGRNSFQADQQTLLDKKRVYEITLQSFPSGIFAKLIGFPKLDLAKYDIVTSDETEKAFSTKKSAPIKLR